MKKRFKILFQVLIFVLPWMIRRLLLNKVLGYRIHKTARIGLSIVIPDRLTMEEGSKITSFTFINNLNDCRLGKFSKIGDRNWISGTNTAYKAVFHHSPNRVCELVLGEHTRVTARHFIDCTGGVYLGDFTTVAGIWTQMLSHSIDVVGSRQMAGPVTVGRYCFVGSSCMLLMGTRLPDFSVLGAGAVLTKAYEEQYSLYGGSPARHIKRFAETEILYFKRQNGHVS
jgi:acetyltransferase-like isoleucine patch superfamily enzyme